MKRYFYKELNNYQNISKADKLILTEVEEDLDNKNGVKSYYFIFVKIAEFLDSETTLSFEDWTIDIAKRFIRWTQWEEGTVKNALGILNRIFNKTSNTLVISYTDDFIGETSLKDVLYSFDDFNRRIENGLISEYGRADIIVKHSTAQAILYLVWLGFDPEELNLILKQGYDRENSIISCQNKKYSFGEYPAIKEFFERYNDADSCVVYREGKARNFKYIETPYFLKGIRDGKEININDAVKRSRNLFQVGSVMAERSGQFDRLFKWEQNGGVVSKRNAEEIAKIARINYTATGYGKNSFTKLTRLILGYDKYKKIRISRIILED